MENTHEFQEQEQNEQEPKLSTEEMKLLVVLGRALADPTRIRILGLLAERPMYGQELAKALDVTPPTISHHLSPLVMAGLVRVRRENSYHYYELSSEGLEQLAESTQQIARAVFAHNPLPPRSEERARVVATFLQDGRLASMPSQYKKRRYVMEELARSFEWGRLYDEKEVNAILKTFHEDVASLRREMIDQRIMMRENGRYWLVRPHE
ncbi:MAG TPA: metalloregulator ArsR/SmtB family transcription factor [Ktedonobacteraceae bacterium]|nr:metalloregulator ArsR/SmtB family transcription factor [Ktedonobacteraceae bacterium]